MRLSTSAQAGSDKKSDVLVTVSPCEELAVKLVATPTIQKQFGAQIEQVTRQAAADEGVDGAYIEVKDGGGALDFGIRARVRTALRRAKGVAEDE